jgi:hypothetical protein
VKPLLTLCLAAPLLLAPWHATQAQSTPEASAASPAADVATSAAKIDVIVVNPEDLLDTDKTLVVPTLYIKLVTSGRVSAAKQSGLFSGGNATARASAAYKVAGLDKAYAQQLAQAAYDDFVAQLRQAGYKVLTYADVKDRDAVRSAQRDTSAGPLGLPESSEGGNTFITAAPSDEQFFKSGLGGGAFAEFQSGGKSRFLDATLIIPQFTFHSPQAWAEGSRGYRSVSAEANVAEGMNMFQANAHWMGQPRSRMMRGIPGVATKTQLVNVTEKAGSLTKVADTTPQAANALSGALSLFGAGNIQRSGSEYLMTIDREAYSRGVLNGVRSFNAEVARAAAAAAKP